MITKFEFMKNHYYDFRRMPHVVVVGASGTGKSLLLSFFILQLQKINSDFLIIDTKLGDLYQISKILNENGALEDTEDIINEIETIVDIMNKRQKIISKSNVIGIDFTDFNMTPIFLIIDELNATVTLFDKKQRDRFYQLITLIVLKGRSAGVQLIIGSQQLNSQIFPTNLRDQISFRIFLANSNSQITKISRDMLFGNIDNYPNKKDGFGGWYLLENESIGVQTFQSPEIKNISLSDFL